MEKTRRLLRGLSAWMNVPLQVWLPILGFALNFCIASAIALSCVGSHAVTFRLWHPCTFTGRVGVLHSLCWSALASCLCATFLQRRSALLLRTIYRQQHGCGTCRPVSVAPDVGRLCSTQPNSVVQLEFGNAGAAGFLICGLRKLTVWAH